MAKTNIVDWKTITNFVIDALRDFVNTFTIYIGG